jgi:SAM-dependent methyltransferase
VELAKGKRVLNIGCCGSDALVNEVTVHRSIAEVASYCVGIDIYEAGIEKMRGDGEHVFLADGENFELDEKDFDLVVLGDIIEHVSNPGLVLENSNRHLKDEGGLVVSTPTPFALPLMLRIIRSSSYETNSEHVSWFDPVMLTYLLARAGFEPEEVFWTDATNRAPYKLVQRRRPSFHNTFGIIAKKMRQVGPHKVVQRIQTSATTA